MADPVARLVVYGTPGTAGSKSGFAIYRGTGADRHFTGRVNVTEKPSKTKTSWRAGIVDEVRRTLMCTCGVAGCVELRPPFPLDEALVASAVFTVKKPLAAPKTVRTWPTARPDLLKYTRAAEDALKDAGLFSDDARIVRYLDHAKVYPGEDRNALPVPGMVFTLWRMADLTMWQRDAVVTPAPVDLSLFDDLADLRSNSLNPPGGATPKTPPPGAGGA